MMKVVKNKGSFRDLTNGLVQETCICRLMDAEVPANCMAQLSGHNNLKSLDSYKTASSEHQCKMSLVSSNSTKTM